jgi:cation transport regulator ChaC
MSYDEALTIEEGIDMPVKDLVVIVREAHVAVMGKLTDEEKAEMAQQKVELMNQFRQRLQTHLQDKTKLTDEEIDQIANKVKQTIRTTTKEEWKETAETWRNMVEERRQNNNNSDDNDTTE